MHEANARDKAQGFENIFGANGSERLGNKVFLYYFNKFIANVDKYSIIITIKGSFPLC